VIPHSYTKQRVSNAGAIENLENEPSQKRCQTAATGVRGRSGIQKPAEQVESPAYKDSFGVLKKEQEGSFTNHMAKTANFFTSGETALGRTKTTRKVIGSNRLISAQGGRAGVT
jgi:hypothetical protein